MKGLHTDLYQIAMAAGYFSAGKTAEKAVFELFVRRMPANREYLIAAGLKQAVDYLVNLRFDASDVAYLRSIPVLAKVPEDFWAYLLAFRFTGTVFAMPEGTPFYPGEPILTLHAPIIEAQIPETFLLATLSFQSMIASKAIRVVDAAAGRPVVEFGSRRAHSPDAAVLASRAAYVGGCTGTSNLECGRSFGVPVFGTSAHSWVQAFPNEKKAFQSLQALLGEQTVYLIDTYDTVQGARQAAELGHPIWGVRLDSGDLLSLSKSVRQILNHAGLHHAKIMASSDLNERLISELLAAGAPIDVFGVGTELITSGDAPSLSAVYKLSEVDVSGIKRYTVKRSVGKQTLPGAKQVFRYADKDVIGCATECSPDMRATEMPRALLRPAIIGGQVVGPIPSLAESREYCAAERRKIQSNRPVFYSPELNRLARQQGIVLKP